MFNQPNSAAVQPASSCVVVFFVVQIFFKKRVLDEEGYILSVKKNGLLILIPKYGLEGTIYMKKTKPPNLFVFNEQVQIVTLIVCLLFACV